MDLKNNRITLGELLSDPGARSVLQRRFPLVMKHDLSGPARTVTLEQILALAGEYVPRKKIDDVLTELRRA